MRIHIYQYISLTMTCGCWYTIHILFYNRYGMVCTCCLEMLHIHIHMLVLTVYTHEKHNKFTYNTFLFSSSSCNKNVFLCIKSRFFAKPGSMAGVCYSIKSFTGLKHIYIQLHTILYMLYRIYVPTLHMHNNT